MDHSIHCICLSHDCDIISDLFAVFNCAFVAITALIGIRKSQQPIEIHFRDLLGFMGQMANLGLPEK